MEDGRQLPPRGSRKAWLRVTRETCGINEDEFAGVAGCSVGEVILWEMPDGPEPPDEVCEWLVDALADRTDQVDGLVEGAIATRRPGEPVIFEYVQTQEDFDRLFPHLTSAGVPVSYHNATLRSAAERLRYLGVPVVWAYARA